MTTIDRITAHLTDAGYSDAQIKQGLAWAEQQGWSDDDEALSLTLTRILYDEHQIADGARFAVEPGSW